jgi:hypothetical protein
MPPMHRTANSALRSPGPRSLLVGFGLVCWLVVVVAGFAWLWHYKSIPGAAGAAPEQWPAASQLPRADDRPTLVMLTHPKCDCTRASLSELRQVMSRFSDRVAAHVLLVRPPDSPASWVSSASVNWALASSIPGVDVREDIDGVEAARFGAETSGEVVLYSPQGRLLFRGGITGVRGHEGDNLGLQRLTAALATPPAQIVGQVPGQVPGRIAESQVFGCALKDPVASVDSP